MVRRFLILLLIGIHCALAGAAERREIEYNRDVRPILASACFSCHGPDASARKAKLRLDLRDAAMLKQSSGATAIVPGKLEQSEMVRRILGDDPDDVMPPPKAAVQLTAAQKRTLRDWIAQGAPYSAHWSYQPILNPAPPAPKNEKWGHNAIDRFVLARLEAAGLTPAPEASAAMLLRRITFDLTGLPPRPEDIPRAAELVAPGSAYIDQLLKSEAHGEHLARKWMDVARYADSAGYELDTLFWQAWRYRDYLIRAFRDNKPLDRFIIEQIAGDQLWPDSDDAKDAALFLTVGPKRHEGGIQRAAEREYEWLTDATDATAAAFLGVTIGCARCHDHKFDPISQADYFGLQSIFADSQLDERKPAKDHTGFGVKNSQAFFVMPRPQPVTRQILRRGELDLPLRDAPAALPASFPGGGALPPTLAGNHRRELLAKWLTSPDNPLVARVLANRVWQWHFGKGLVRTPDDFGIKGELPTHPELLDYLASELVRSGWNLRHLHQLILESATYRMSSSGTREAVLRDPDHRLLSRFPRRRLSSEELRDAMLAASGELNAAPFGPPVVPPVEDFELAGIRNNNWEVTPDPKQHTRRSIYLVVRRSVTTAFARAFDSPDTASPCTARNATVVPGQSLTLWNSRDSVIRAQSLAGRLWTQSHGDLNAATEFACKLLYGRSATPMEHKLAKEFVMARLKTEAANAQSPPSAWVEWCLALLNTNEFLYVD